MIENVMFLIDTLLYIYTTKRYFGGFMKQLDKENHKNERN